jgi:lysyl endopeptidase
MFKPILTLVGAMFVWHAHCQVSYGGEPNNWHDKTLSSEIPFERMPEVDVAVLAAEDAITDQYKDQPYRFGYEHEVSLDMSNSGRVTTDQSGERKIWQLGIHCPGALSVSLRFDNFSIPQGGQVYIWSADRTEFIGSFDHRSNKPSGVLATGMVHGEQIVIEYSYPAHYTEIGQLEVGLVVHTYRPFVNSPFFEDALQEMRGPFGDSGACEVNINCPEGDEWQVEKRSVAVIVSGGSGLCSGALVNNTANDGTPYFLTADHCLVGSVANWIFYFNHESTNCTGSTGPTNQSISGAELVASNAASDFALLLLDDTPPASYNVQYAGWDATDAETVTAACCIHHPGGDVKKIAYEEDSPYHDTGAGAQVWWIDNWEVGVTEGGSSGSPLFDQNHRIIGQLYGGASACNGANGNGLFDYYGRFGVSWDNTNNASSRLIDWLDPGNTGTLVMDGYPDGFTAEQYDASVSAIGNILETNCSSNLNPTFQLANQGSENLTTCTINYQVNNGTIQVFNWSGNLEQGENEIVALPTIVAANGNNTLTIWVSNPNGESDGNETNNETTLTFTAIAGTAYDVNILINFDSYPQETSWELINSNNQVLFSGNEYDQQPDGSTMNIGVCLSEGCYEFVMMDSAGDGLCCGYGNGEYVVTDQFGQVVADGADFDSEEITEFCISATNIDATAEASFEIYPNPASTDLRVISADVITTLQLIDMTGRIVIDLNPNSTIATPDVSGCVDGIYTIRISTLSGSYSSKLMVRK